MLVFYACLCCFFFFKQKTAYELRISDWSSDVCSSDLRMRAHVDRAGDAGRHVDRAHMIEEDEGPHHPPLRIGQHAPDLESAEILASLIDDEVYHGCSPCRCQGNGKP